jgi:hypothetical protein
VLDLWEVNHCVIGSRCFKSITSKKNRNRNCTAIKALKLVNEFCIHMFSTVQNFITVIMKDNELVWQVTCIWKITNMSQYSLENLTGRAIFKDYIHVRG